MDDTRPSFDKPPPDTILFAQPFTVATDALPMGNFRCREALFQSDPSNAVNVLIGSAGSQPITLSAGAGVSLPVPNTGLVYARAASATAVVNVLAVA